jgi:hypothetical protein
MITPSSQNHFFIYKNHTIHRLTIFILFINIMKKLSHHWKGGMDHSFDQLLHDMVFRVFHAIKQLGYRMQQLI